MDGVEKVMVQFSFSNKNLIPDFIPRLPKEIGDKNHKRKNGKCLKGLGLKDKSINNCSFHGFDPETLDLKLIDVECQKRIHKGNQGTYQMVRFVFGPRHYVVSCSEIVEHKGEYMSFFRTLCDESYWRLKSFLNPRVFPFDDIDKGKKWNIVLIKDGKRNLSLNLEVRQPRFKSNGDSVMARKKNDNGKSVGDPIEIDPTHYLFVENKDLYFLHLN